MNLIEWVSPVLQFFFEWRPSGAEWERFRESLQFYN